MEVRPFSEDGRIPGVEVLGLDVNNLQDEVLLEKLRSLWVWYGIVVFRGLTGVQTQLDLSRVFGDLQQHPVRESWAEGCPELIDLRYRPEQGTIYEVDGRERGAYLPWHSDLVYVDKINHGGILRPVQAAKEDGETGFIDQIAAYERLPEKLKNKIENLNVIYKLNFFSDQAKFGHRPKRLIRAGNAILGPMKRVDEYPRVLHPMVYSQKETGRKVLNVSPWFALGIHEQENPEGDALLSEVVEYCIDESVAYFHRWNEDDMVLWDNWRVLHCARGVNPHSTRWMQRTTIVGDYALGRVENAETIKEDMHISI